MNFAEIEKQKTSSEFWLWKNIEKFVANHYICLLDKLLCIQDSESQVPQDRYRNFDSEFIKHFSLLSRSAIRQGKHKYPFIGVKFSSDSKNRFSRCTEDIDIYFHIVYNPVSPASCDNENCSVCVSSLEEDYLRCITDLLINMFSFTKKIAKTNGYKSEHSNLFQELYCKDDWTYNMRVLNNGEPFVSDINARDDETLEIYLRIPVRVVSKTSNCNCDDTDLGCNC